MYDWTLVIDPYVAAPALTLKLLDYYFAYVNSSIFGMFPRSHFLHWLKRTPPKSGDEHMVLYAMLAAASIFIDDSWSHLGKQCAHIAADAIVRGQGSFTVVNAQTKILLGIYHASKGPAGSARMYYDSAIAEILSMQLNTEDECTSSRRLDEASSNFDMSIAQIAEVKRRTFWSAFLYDRYTDAAVCIIKPREIFVRLPCRDDLYEQGVLSDAPHYSDTFLNTAHTMAPSTLNQMPPSVLLILAAAIWGDVVDFAFCATHRGDTAYRNYYENEYLLIWDRLYGWIARLPSNLQYGPENLDQSIQAGFADIFLTMHVLHHLSWAKLNRCLRHAVFPDPVARNTSIAMFHSHLILELIATVNASRKNTRWHNSARLYSFEWTAPMAGYAVLFAIDVVSARGASSDFARIIEEIKDGLVFLRELSKVWAASTRQLELCDERCHEIEHIASLLRSPDHGSWSTREWGFLPIEHGGGYENDCIHGFQVSRR